ncbi:DUF2254 domain-containing protein [Stappia sp.]|uniref:DUF2254 domain-containing protein n=1 Tax=Stappia sp. TaxID=1870903 RepID=UPI003A99D0FE
MYFNAFTARIHVLVRGFFFLPGLLAVLGVLLAVATVAVDRSSIATSLFDYVAFLNISADGARSVLSTIAGAMMTVLSLVYSLTLVVFTLAAGNIGPRLLETFTDNRVNQTTIGLLGATFLHALIVLYIVGDDDVPRFAVATAIVLATVSFFWLVYFVHDTARRVMVDNEIARTQRKLRSTIERLLSDEPREEPDDREALPKEDGAPVPAARSGYITAIGTAPLLSEASAKDGFIRIVAVPGHFVIQGQPIAYVYGEIEGDRVRRAVRIEDARTPDGDMQFAIHLTLEIALRALSPGINDSYTAISSIDQLSASLALILQRGVPSSLICDSDGKPRVWVELLEVKDMVGTALHPLRRVTRGNVMVTMRLVDAVGRMALVTRRHHAPILAEHLLLIASGACRSVDTREDRTAIAELIRRARRSIHAARGRH